MIVLLMHKKSKTVQLFCRRASMPLIMELRIIVFFPGELGELGVVGTRYGGPEGGAWQGADWAARSAAEHLVGDAKRRRTILCTAFQIILAISWYEVGWYLISQLAPPHLVPTDWYRQRRFNCFFFHLLPTRPIPTGWQRCTNLVSHLVPTRLIDSYQEFMPTPANWPCIQNVLNPYCNVPRTHCIISLKNMNHIPIALLYLNNFQDHSSKCLWLL